MNCEEEAIANGWMKLKRGWYHDYAQAYHGWGIEPKCFETAEEALQYQASVIEETP